MTLVHRIKTHARSLGFDLVGVTSPDPPAHVEFYERWLSAGYHGSMAYLATERARERRRDPRLILPDCRSIIVLGMRYYPAPQIGWRQGATADDASPERLTGQVAAYAWGEDYHDVLAERLDELVAFIEKEIGASLAQRRYTDTGPVLERDLAQRAGLGWIGKNTCLINPSQGSYFFLAEIFLDIDLEPDKPFLPDRCGSCTRCIQACPTGCILPERALDASRCISYLTIELKDAIPLDLRPQMEDWVFGCDVCQQVCPWNVRFASAHTQGDFAPRSGVPFPNLIAELSLTPGDFNRKFKGSPLKRSKRRGYLRNVCVALGNSGDRRAVPPLEKCLHEEDEALVRRHAAWALGKLGGERALTALEAALDSEREPEVLAEIRTARKMISSKPPG